MKKLKFVVAILLCCTLFAGAQSINEPPLNPNDTTWADTTNHRPEGTLTVVDRKLDHRAQIVGSLGMMVFIGLVMATVQTWNPR